MVRVPRVRRDLPALVALGLATLAGPSCRHAAPAAELQAPADDWAPPIELEAPACCETGPSVELAKVTRHMCGKGDTCTTLDLRIRNPEARALFFLVDGDRPFDAHLSYVDIIHHSWGPPTPPVWSFSGNLAFKVPAGENVLIRQLDYTRDLDELVAVFVDKIVLDYDRQIDAADAELALPAQGDLDMSWLRRGFISGDHDRKEVFRLPKKERVTVSTWCLRKVPLPR